MTDYVLDASAVLAALFGERGCEQVIPHLHQATISAVNYSEVLAKTMHLTGSLVDAKRHVDRYQFEVVPFDAELAAVAASLQKQTRALGLSLADRACLALGLSRSWPVLTADRAWLALELGTTVVCIR